MDLSACKSGGDILGLTDEFTNLETLDLSNSTITNLKAFPKLENLKKVIILHLLLFRAFTGVRIS